MEQLADLWRIIFPFLDLKEQYNLRHVCKTTRNLKFAPHTVQGVYTLTYANKSEHSSERPALWLGRMTNRLGISVVELDLGSPARVRKKWLKSLLGRGVSSIVRLFRKMEVCIQEIRIRLLLHFSSVEDHPQILRLVFCDDAYVNDAFSIMSSDEDWWAEPHPWPIQWEMSGYSDLFSDWDSPGIWDCLTRDMSFFKEYNTIKTDSWIWDVRKGDVTMRWFHASLTPKIKQVEELYLDYTEHKLAGFPFRGRRDPPWRGLWIASLKWSKSIPELGTFLAHLHVVSQHAKNQVTLNSLVLYADSGDHQKKREQGRGHTIIF